MILSDTVSSEAAAHLSHHDPVLRPVIERTGLCPVRPHRNYYQELVESIIGQQLSVAAAAAIEKRFIDLFEGVFPTAEQIASADADTLRSIGFSRAKVAYVQDLALKVLTGELSFDGLDAMTNDQIISHLTAVKGIGVWTAHMFMLFCMGRSDVLAVGDLGVQNGIKALYGLTERPDADAVTTISEKYEWHPYESVACWYVWQSLNNTPKLS